jgi:4-amino-4-deoxy-L-arabinose transferase-like glycosyltransferase
VGDYGVETDFFWGYVPDAKSFISGEVKIDPFRGPLYPITLGLVNLIVSEYFYSGMLIGIISASLLLALSFKLIGRIFSPVVAFVVTLLVAVNPIFIQYTYSAGTDMFFNVLAVATLFFFFKEKELNYKYLVMAAFIAGLSYMTRYNGVFLLGFVIIILFVNFWKIDWFRRIKASVIFLCVFFITFSPWGFYCLAEKGSFYYNENYKNIAYELFGKGKVSWDQFWFDQSSNYTSLFDVIGRDFPLFISTIIGNIGEHFILDMESLTGWFTGAFVILGLIILIISNPFKNFRSRETGYYLSNLLFFGLLLMVFYSERFSLFLIPFYSVIAIQPFFIKRFKTFKIIPQKLGYAVAIFLLIITIAKSISFNSARIDSGPNELLELREWYMTNVPLEERGNKIASRKAHVAYYLDMEFSLIPLAETYPELLKKLQENNADYLYFSTMEAAMRRQFQFLLNPKENHPGLKPVVYFENPPAVLYKIVE